MRAKIFLRKNNFNNENFNEYLNIHADNKRNVLHVNGSVSGTGRKYEVFKDYTGGIK
jgi:hypothetical protein